MIIQKKMIKMKIKFKKIKKVNIVKKNQVKF